MGSLAGSLSLLVPVSFEETSERRVNSKTDVSKCQMASDWYSETLGALLCAVSVFSVSCMLRDVHVATVFVSLWPIAYSPFAICQGCNRPIVSRCYEPVAEHWSLHPFSINPNSCLAP